MRRHHVFDLRGHFTPQVNDGFCRLHVNARTRKLQPARADFRHQPANDGAQPVGHFSEWQAARSALNVFNKAFHRALAFASAAWL